MSSSFRQIVFATSAIIGLSAFAAAAAPPAAARPAATAKPDVRHDMTRQIEQRIADLHAKLQITPAQQLPWDQFAQVMRDNSLGMEATFHHRMDALAGMTAPENMQSYAEVATAHAQDAQKMVPAFQALYATLSDTQKRLADQAFRDGGYRGAPMHRG